MGMQRLVGLRLLPESKSYIDALHGILSHSGLYTAPKYMLTGMTVTGFRFTVDRLITAESPTAYNWMAENFLAADFIGITSDQQAGFSFEPTFPLYQNEAIHAIKQSINRGIGAIIWKDQFVIVTGYDDSRQVLFYSDGMESAASTDRPDRRAVRVSCRMDNSALISRPIGIIKLLMKGLRWTNARSIENPSCKPSTSGRQHDLMLPEGEYSCGKSAYSAIIHALETGCFEKAGMMSVIDTYAAAKRDLACYTQRLEQIWPQSKAVAARYAELNQIYEQIVTTAASTCNERLTVEAKIR